MNVITKNNVSLLWELTTCSEIKKIISELPNKKSSGYDNLDNILLKEIKKQLLEPLCILFNHCLSEGIFPTGMKLADIVPLYKGKEHYLCTNYQPISLLITLSKVLEKVVYKRTYSFLDTTGQFYESQYGFRAKHSCEHAVQELIGSILKGMENKKKTLSIFLDLSKAFDTLSHQVLFEKLSIYGIRGSYLDWFESYLSDHTMRVRCTGKNGDMIISDSQPIAYSMPQGSVLGPLIFLIFNNDLHLHLLYSNCILFSDDTMIYSTHHDIRHLTWYLREDLMTVTDWF